MDYVKGVDEKLDSILSEFIKKPTIIRGAVHLLLMLYAAKIAPDLPVVVLDLFKNQYFKLFVFSMILWTAQFSPSTSILISLGFLISVNHVNNKPLFEFIENTDLKAPSKEIAIESAKIMMDKKGEIVDKVEEDKKTIIVQPSISQDGKTIVNPSIVIAPLVVSGEDGTKMVVHPDVSHLKVESQGPMPSPLSPEQTKAQPAEFEAEAEEKKEKKQEEKKEDEGCYPMRHYDISKVSPRSMAGDFEDYKEWSA